MEILKKYKKSTKFICKKCGFPVTAVDHSECVRSERCSPCIEHVRVRKMNWKLWEKGMKKSE
jgi:hypothetical protein